MASNSEAVRTDVVLAAGAALQYATNHFDEWFGEMIATPEYGDAEQHREYWRLMLAGAMHSTAHVMQGMHAKHPELFNDDAASIPDHIPPQWEEE